MTTDCVLESCMPSDRFDAVGVTSAPALGQTDLPCQMTDADLWFAEDPRDLERAKAMCAECPLREACLAAALERAEPWGVWGGLTWLNFRHFGDRGAVTWGDGCRGGH